MTKKEKAEIQERLEDKQTTDELRAYIQGCEDGIDSMYSQLYWFLALGMLLGGVIVEVITLF
jgi:hypothetical protein